MARQLCVVFAVLLAGLHPLAEAALDPKIQAALQDVATMESNKYNCSFNIAFVNADGTATAAAGTNDFAIGSRAATSDAYAWGSCTKMLTGASIMKLVSEGKFSLGDTIGNLLDPYFAKRAKIDPTQNFTTLEGLWGPSVSNVTVRNLLAMHDGVPDFDTATPSFQGKPSTDSLRAKLYKEPSHFSSPTELMSVPWVAGAENWLSKCKSRLIFSRFCYSSTNFMLLGFLIGVKTGLLESGESWSHVNQSAFLPAQLRELIHFANSGAPKDYGAAHGYDRTSYNLPTGQKADHDNIAVDGVFGGWTASNIVATASTMAELTWQIWGPPSAVAPKAYTDQMIPSLGPYGLATFNLEWVTGVKGPDGKAYGHLGATYGYQSVVAYFPKLNVAMSLASNIETDSQSQVMDGICVAYNRVRGVMIGKDLNCTFKSMGFYGGRCTCPQEDDESDVLLV